ncbi:HEAT repeat domain-containing protein [Actinomadura rudentiformis]|uniref:HEAT repeat domain-containing protein n=1 Tax=Actinomadura rudentiformis TaxID=359158 RepID=A0A6H9YZB0_9ACTN|nr:HEAT repeat domain-containing protein [Actinomadura rudentiformis]KAB2352724.1 hypothetical protein F8566_03570 [Actinomadura rudentiformis]
MRELALHARRHRGSPAFRSLLGELAAREHDERRTALHMAMAARDLTHIESVLAGPDLRLRRAALRAVRTLPVSDDAAAAVLDDAPTDLRRAFYRTLLHGRRETLADRLLPEVRERWGEREAGALLPACSADVVAEMLPDLAHGVTAWRALGARHPIAFLDAADRDLRQAAYPNRLLKRSRAALAAAALAEPLRAMSLMEKHELGNRAVSLPAQVITALFAADASRAGRLLRSGSRRRPGMSVASDAQWRACPDEELFAAAPTDAHRLPGFLKALPPSRREPVYDAVLERRGGEFPGLHAREVLAWLPPARAAAEARRMLDWHGSVWHSARSRLDDPEIPLKLTAHLPYEEAAEPLREAALGGDRRRRGTARTLLVECAARTGDPEILQGRVVELVHRTVNDQDPLRGALLTALAKVRPALLTDASAPQLEALAIAAVDSRDSSEETRHALRALAARILRHHEAERSPALTAWAFGVYEKLFARHGAGALVDFELDLVLRRGQETELMERLRPHLRAARERQDFEPAVWLAWSLGRRATGFVELQDDLRRAALEAPEPLAHSAACLWLAYAPDRDDRVAGLLADDPAVIAVPEVWRAVSRRRTDLLLPLLDGNGDRVPEVGAGEAGRWTPGQRARVRAVLSDTARDETMPSTARTAAIASLGRLPGTLAELTALAGHADGVLAEAAIEALAHSDEPAKALPVLLAHARGLTSKVAVAAMARCGESVRPSILGPLMAEALSGPDSKVTVRKQAARQLARHRTEGAADVLLRAWRDPGLHPDVRVAVAVALRWMPEDPRALAALGDAAGPYAGELLLRTLYQAQPAEYGPEHRPRYAALVRSLLGASELPGVRFRAARAFATWARWYEGGYADILEAVGDPAAPAEKTEMPVLLALLGTGELGEEVLPVLDRLLATGLDEVARARIDRITSSLTGHRTPSRKALARRAAERLAADPLYVSHAARLYVSLLPAPTGAGNAPSPERFADELAGLAHLLRDRPAHAGRLAGGSLLSRFRWRTEPPALLPAARRLAGEGHLVAGLFAVTIVQRAGPDADWAPEWRELLETLRRSEHLEVRQEAWDVHAS